MANNDSLTDNAKRFKKYVTTKRDSWTQTKIFTEAGEKTDTYRNADSPKTHYAIQAVCQDAVADEWSIVVEVSLTGVEGEWDTVLTHNKEIGDKKILFSGTNFSAALFMRARVESLTLGAASGIKLVITGVP